MHEGNLSGRLPAGSPKTTGLRAGGGTHVWYFYCWGTRLRFLRNRSRAQAARGWAAMVETSSPSRWGCCRSSGRRQQQSEAGARIPVWEGAPGTWPGPSPHTASDCGRLTRNPEVECQLTITALITTNQARQLAKEVGKHHCLSGKPVSTDCWRTISDSMPLLASDIILANWASSKGRCSAWCLVPQVRVPLLDANLG